MVTSPSAPPERRGEILAACDLCHYRKVRCDRKNPCDRCAESFVSCVRTRSLKRTRQRRRPWQQHQQHRQMVNTWPGHSDRNDELPLQDGTSDRRLQNDISLPEPLSSISPGHPTPEINTDHRETRSWGETIDSVRSDPDRQLSPASPDPAPETTRPASWPELATAQNTPVGYPGEREDHITATSEAQTYIQSELGDNQRLSQQQRDLLQLAITMASRMPVTKEASVSDFDTPPTGKADFSDPSMYPSTEAICYLLSGHRTVTTSFHSDLASIISRSTFERMAFALIDGQVEGHVRVQYIVCVNFLALTFAVGLPAGDQTSFVRGRLRALQERYRRNAFTAVHHISVLDPPSLPLLQALLAGAMLFQMAGDVGKCAQLNSAACVVCAQLGGRYFADLASKAGEADSLEVRHSLGHCYIFDKSISMALGRRSLLPEMEVNAALLMPPAVDMPSTPIFNVYIEFAKVQDAIAKGTRSQSTRPRREVIELVRSLRTMMKEIRVKIREFRLYPSHSTEHLLQGEWMGVDFTFFSIMTTIIRLHPDFPIDQYVRDDCLEHARRALSELKNMEDHGLKAREDRNAYCLSVAWVVLMYPLCPFFTLFCNVVETSDRRDFRLLEQVTEGLSMFAENNAAVGSIRELCHTLVSLCRTHIDGLSGIAVSPPDPNWVFMGPPIS
ncbi:hypothetical protein GQ53DRAFT_120380 [Thozetella sp. PMI_491]|nr:hypothetical protein GQ53DRAFT_120380 [Thozetella sp. PMI_491]